MMKLSIFKFIYQVKQEFLKITWPSKKKTVISTVMVFIMIFVMAVYFCFLDWMLSLIVDLLLRLG